MDTSIGERIRQLRKSKHITQTQIYEQTGISSGNLSGIESGKSLPSASAVIELSKILQCSTDYILTGSEHSNSSILENRSLIPNETGKRIISLCKRENINEVSLSKILDIGLSDIIFAETGIVDSKPTIEKIAKYFDVEESYLLNGSSSINTSDLSEKSLLQSYKLLSNDSKSKIMSYLKFLLQEEEL